VIALEISETRRWIPNEQPEPSREPERKYPQDAPDTDRWIRKTPLPGIEPDTPWPDPRIPSRDDE
jgi:hypothetical protein